MRRASSFSRMLEIARAASSHSSRSSDSSSSSPPSTRPPASRPPRAPSDSDIDMNSRDSKNKFHEYIHDYKIVKKMEKEVKEVSPNLLLYKALLTNLISKLKNNIRMSLFVNPRLNDYEKTLYKKIYNCREKMKEIIEEIMDCKNCIEISEEALSRIYSDELKILREQYASMARPPSPIGPEFAYKKSKARKDYDKTIKRRRLKHPLKASGKKKDEKGKGKKTKKSK